MSIISQNLESLRKKIIDCCTNASRPPKSVQLLAVSKGQCIEKLVDALKAGQRLFGENYLQEALPKINALQKNYPHEVIEWHFIGHLQRNKTKLVSQHFQWVHTLTSLLLAQRLNEQRPANLPPLYVCIEVNLSGEAQKSGIASEQVLALIRQCQNLPRLKIRGLMCIPPKTANVSDQKEAFQALVRLQQSINEAGFALDTLSMGMTQDYPAAIAAGATIIRIGTGLFGERAYPLT